MKIGQTEVEGEETKHNPVVRVIHYIFTQVLLFPMSRGYQRVEMEV